MRRESADFSVCMLNFYRKLPDPSPVLVRNAKLVLHESGPMREKSLFIDNRKIVAIGEDSDIVNRYGKGETTIDASGCIVMPGLINTHTHLAMSLLRGYAEDLALMDWLQKKIWPAEAKLTPEYIELGAALSVAEAMLAGTTSVLSMYFYDKAGSESAAIEKLGIRGVVTHAVFDRTMDSGISKFEELVRAYHGADDGRIRASTAPHSPYTCSPETLQKLESSRKELNGRYGSTYPILNSIHVAESPGEAKQVHETYKVDTSKGVAAYLKTLGVLNADTVAAHCTHLTETDYDALKSMNASIASCPTSNLKLGMGVADLRAASAHGINISLGTDGPASNNSLDMFEEMKLASILQKSTHSDTTLFPAKSVFDMATINGARALHQQGDIGSIATGKRADIVVMDVSQPHSLPLYDAYSHIIFSAKAADVKHVIIDGRVTVLDRNVVALDTERLTSELDKALQELKTLRS